MKPLDMVIGNISSKMYSTEIRGKNTSIFFPLAEGYFKI